MSRFECHPDDRLVVVSSDDRLVFAQAQLCQYLSLVLSKAVDGITADTLGRQASVKTIHLSLTPNSGLSDEGYRFETEASSLRIIAGGVLGMNFAVFAFLRNACGCQFSGLAPDGENIPRLARLCFENQGDAYEPILTYRGLQFTTLEPLDRQAARLDWMLKNGMNRVLIRFNPDEDAVDEVDPQTGMRHAGVGSEGPRMSLGHVDEHLLPLAHERGLKIDISHHNLRCWLPAKRWLDQHPQWFALGNGKRGGDPRQLYLCTTNKQAVEELIRTIDHYLQDRPQIDFIGVIPEDGIGMCQCAACVATDNDPSDVTRPWQGMLQSESMNASKARRYALLLNQVANALAPRHPQVTIVGAAYVDLAAPPADVKLADNIAIWLAVYWRDGARPLSLQGGSPINHRYRELIDAWSRHVPGRLYLYEYYMGMNAQLSLPYPMSRVIVKDWQLLEGLTQGATVQCLTSLHEAYGLNQLAFARSGWHKQVSHDQVLEDWLVGMFGEARDSVLPIFERWLESVDRIAESDGLKDQAGAQFLDGDLLKPDARNIVYLMADLPEDWLRDQLTLARASAVEPRVHRQLDRLEHYLSYCHAAARLVRAMEDQSSEHVSAALQSTLDHMDHPLATGWIAPAHAIRWRRFAKSRLTMEAAR